MSLISSHTPSHPPLPSPTPSRHSLVVAQLVCGECKPSRLRYVLVCLCGLRYVFVIASFYENAELLHYIDILWK